MSALESWRTQLADWAIPPDVLAAAPDPPWELPRPVFRNRADRRISDPTGPSYTALRQALDPPGSVLDVGAGAGAASLPLFEEITAVTAVDTDPELLAAFEERAARVNLRARTVLGRWPDVADTVEPADVVVCGHVLYNVPDFGPFVAALTAHARRRVVVEITERHPLTPLNPLWLRFHGLRRPDGPSADDAIAALREAGVEPRVTRWERAAETEYDSFAQLVDITRRRLCLPPDRGDDVAAALREQGGHSPRRRLVTLSWPGRASAGTRAAGPAARW